MCLSEWHNRLLFKISFHNLCNLIGKNCEIGANLCLSNPCINNGSCSTVSNSYLCSCSPPYAGPNCELIINVCTPNPCFNDGTCVRSLNILDGTYQCHCQNGFIGTRCEYCE